MKPISFYLDCKQTILNQNICGKRIRYLGPDHVQVNQSEAWFPIDLFFQNTYASKTLAHDPALNDNEFMLE